MVKCLSQLFHTNPHPPPQTHTHTQAHAKASPSTSLAHVSCIQIASQSQQLIIFVTSAGHVKCRHCAVQRGQDERERGRRFMISPRGFQNTGSITAFIRLANTNATSSYVWEVQTGGTDSKCSAFYTWPDSCYHRRWGKGLRNRPWSLAYSVTVRGEGGV